MWSCFLPSFDTRSLGEPINNPNVIHTLHKIQLLTLVNTCVNKSSQIRQYRCIFYTKTDMNSRNKVHVLYMSFTIADLSSSHCSCMMLPFSSREHHCAICVSSCECIVICLPGDTAACCTGLELFLGLMLIESSAAVTSLTSYGP